METYYSNQPNEQQNQIGYSNKFVLQDQNKFSIESLQNYIKTMKQYELQYQNLQINTAIAQSKLGNYQQSLQILEKIDPFQQNILQIVVLKIQNLLKLQRFEQMQKTMEQFANVKKSLVYNEEEDFISLVLMNFGHGFNKFELVFLESYFEYYLIIQKQNKQTITNKFQLLELDFQNLCNRVQEFAKSDPDKFNKILQGYKELYQSVCYNNDNIITNNFKYQNFSQNYLYFNNQGIHLFRLKNYYLAQKNFEKSIKLQFSLSSLYNFDMCNIKMNIFKISESSMKNKQIGLLYTLQNFLFQNQQTFKKFISYQAVVQFSHSNKCFIKEKNHQINNNEIQYLKMNIYKLKGQAILKNAKNLIMDPQNDLERSFLIFINICFQNFYMANYHLEQMPKKSLTSQIYQAICDFYTKGSFKMPKFQNIQTIQGFANEFSLFDKTDLQWLQKKVTEAQLFQSYKVLNSQNAASILKIAK